jgi:hypothetical protein
MFSHPHRLLTLALEFDPHRLLNRPYGRYGGTRGSQAQNLARGVAVQQSSLAPPKDCSKRNR